MGGSSLDASRTLKKAFRSLQENQTGSLLCRCALAKLLVCDKCIADKLLSIYDETDVLWSSLCCNMIIWLALVKLLYSKIIFFLVDR